MNIIVNGDKIIIDGYQLYGWICSETCKSCGDKLLMNETLDAMFCAHCNEWKEKGCNDPDCIQCTNRPERPLP